MPIDHFSYGAVTPTLSYTLSVLGSLLGLVCTARARAMEDSRRRARWLLLAAWSIGGTGIWVMHFMAMLGFSVAGIPIRYDLATTVASWLTAVVVVAIGLFIAGFGQPGPVKIVMGGVITGLGVAAMHYTGMAAMRMPAIVHYDQTLVAASIAIAVVAATVALWFTVTVRRGSMILIAALVMGVAVNGMHFTGMFAMSVEPDPSPGPVTGLMPIYFVAPIALFVILVVIVLLTALISRGGMDDSESGSEPGTDALTRRLLAEAATPRPGSAGAPGAAAPTRPGSRIAGAFGVRPSR
jgi:MHYT domain (predicted integral membrane sensor domain)